MISLSRPSPPGLRRAPRGQGQDNEEGREETVVKLKTPLYHGTRCDNLSSILKAGLSKECEPIHNESVWRAGKEYIPGKGRRLSECGVYLTKYIDSAISYAFDATCGYDDEEHLDPNPDNACILKVKCLAKGARVGSDGFGDMMTNKNIPPECIEMVPKKKWEKAMHAKALERIAYAETQRGEQE